MIGSHSHPRDKNKKLDSVADAGKIKAKISANVSSFASGSNLR